MEVHILIGRTTVGVYRNKERALHDAWLMTEGDKYSDDPISYWVETKTVDEEEYEALYDPTPR